MKKINKILLAVGSVTSLVSLPLVAANCGGTKEEAKKPETKDPKDGGSSAPSTNPTENQPQGDQAGKEENDTKELETAKKDYADFITKVKSEAKKQEKNEVKEVLEALVKKADEELNKLKTKDDFVSALKKLQTEVEKAKKSNAPAAEASTPMKDGKKEEDKEKENEKKDKKEKPAVGDLGLSDLIDDGKYPII
ncbi:Hypothetical protein, predicted lipoprotein [Metamycoplasma auris 15026]|uniref:Uncharacterized protein n=1 Tax=Metamycoplasma auris 15026 TaxID=1188233 RepID=N9VBH9_9BACT|nr:variable surface lipoprotein [Metamycoplasma auris]ENY68751.1 Hypothetical protein, predicted lipoprotein [Metamycoplasma auris 15026]